MKNPRTDVEITETLDDVQVTLDVVVEHLGLDQDVRKAIAAARLKAEQSRLEIERSLGQGADNSGEGRR